jgi:hypothetical protein
MNAVLPLQMLEVRQPNVRFMHQSRSLERVIPPLARHVVAGKAP